VSGSKYDNNMLNITLLYEQDYLTDYNNYNQSISISYNVTQHYREYYKITGLFDDSHYAYIQSLFNFFIIIILTIGIGKRLELTGKEYVTLFIMDLLMLSAGFSTELFYTSIVISIVYLIFKIRGSKNEE
jgi:hypothetical protein